MDLKSCMNFSCGTKSSTEWKTGWRLRSGEFVNLCDKCGYAFEQCIYCEEFHANEPGWRECVTCGKRLHCGCIASLSLIELLDGGGVKCIGCARNLDPISSLNDGKCDGSRPSALTLSNGGLKQLSDYNGINGNYQPLGQVGGTSGSNLAQSPIDLFQKAKLHMSAINIQVKDHFEAIAQPNLNITLGIPTGNLHSTSVVVNDVKDNRTVSNAFHQGFGTHHLLSRPPKLALSPVPDTNASVVPSIRVARPPVEGRGRHQLLPRYWPRITDQELQQISGDSNCTIVPLFEKVLSASDAGRIGRLVLPKACAEAYFPPISQPEGLPIKIQDVKGKEWVFQFRFWPNNNSRMYVLEGVTPCIHSMELQAGDTVTFSRIDPGGKLVMGFRKASTSISMQPTKGSSDPHMNALSRQLDTAGGNIRWPNSEKYGERVEDGLLAASTPLERKKSRNMGSKSKRLLIDSQDVVALRLSWDEVQGLLRPPQNARPNIVVVDDYEFEEYEEPPVFGKSSIFTACSSGAIEQWAQCDSCFKWRRLPADILLPPRWTCSENVWDKSRCFCSASDDLGLKELENLLQQSKDSKKRRMAMTSRMIHDKESTGLDALANAATLGDNTNDPSSSSVAATTKHPRHRPGCSCIVCIQPPSGKGKHKSTCTCTVCMTVKRRFKTLMMRKKKRQSEQEAEIALKNQLKESPNNLQEADNRPGEAEDYSRVGPSLNHDGGASAESGKGLDLNCDPEREEDIKAGPIQESLRDLLRLAGLPLESYMKQNGLTCLTCEQQGGGLGTQLGQSTGETECQTVEDNLIAQQERVNPGDGLDNKQQNEEPS